MLNNLLARLHYYATKAGCSACGFLNRSKPFKCDQSQTRANTKRNAGAGTLNLESTYIVRHPPLGHAGRMYLLIIFEAETVSIAL